MHQATGFGRGGHRTGSQACLSAKDSRDQGQKGRVSTVERLTVHVNLLRQLNELHLGGHVAHGAHAVAQVPAVDVAVLVLIEFSEGLSELWGSGQRCCG